MIWFPDLSTIVSVGGITIKWYVVTLLAGCIAGYLYHSSVMKSHGYKQAVSDDLLILTIIGAVIGGRFFWVLENLKNYSMYAWYVFAIRDGGIDVLGSILFVSVFVLLYGKKHHLSFRRTMDVISVAMLIAVGIARVGRALETQSVWFVVAMNIVEFIIVYYGMLKWTPTRKRGDAFAALLILAGLERLVAMVFGLDPLAVDNVWPCILCECVGIFLWAYARFFDKRKPVVLFDFDGTIMDSEQMIIGCFAYIYQKHGDIADFTEEIQKEVFGPPLRDELEKLFPNEDPDILMAEYTNFQKSLPGKHIVSTLPHTQEVLKKLKREGYVLGIVTSRLTDSCLMWVKDLGLEEYFNIVVGTEKYRHAKPEPDGIIEACELLNTGHDSVVYVGDNVSDVMSGKHAGVYTVAFVTNPAKKEKLEAVKPNEIIEDITQLVDILDANHDWSSELM